MKEAVSEEDIASVVSRWTGIPVDKMLEGEREKLLQYGRSNCVTVLWGRTRR